MTTSTTTPPPASRRFFCPEREGGCAASLTETDFECGYCTQCQKDIMNTAKTINVAKGVKGVQSTHGMSGTTEYQSYMSMKDRCCNPRNERYHRYGGRGITICSRWLERFMNFYTDMGPKPSPRHSIERRNNDGNYEPDNCYWAVPIEQQNNTCWNVKIEHKGKTQTVSQWSRETGINQVTIRARLRRGWSTEQIFNADVSHTHKRALMVKTCSFCQIEFRQGDVRQRYCSEACQRKGYRLRQSQLQRIRRQR